MKTGDKVRINILEPERFTANHYNHLKGASGIIEKEYPNDLLCGNFEKYKWLVKLDAPIKSTAANWPDSTHQWFRADELRRA